MPTHHLKSAAKKLLGLSSTATQHSHAVNNFDVNGMQISNLRLLQRKNSDTLGKVGMLSWVGEMGDSQVKIYECRSESQARFIEALSNDERVARYLPRCYARERAFLMVEWVDGSSVSWSSLTNDSKLMDQMAAIHASFHQLNIDYWPDEKCYFFDYLESRFERFRNVLPLDHFVDKVFSVLKDDLPKTEARLSHPDITPVNVVVDDSTGTLKAIDNDLFTHTHYFLIDLFIVHRSIGAENVAGIMKEYLSHYKKNGGNLEMLLQHEAFFNALWTYRVVGTLLQENKVQDALNVAQYYLEDKMPTHPLIDLVKVENLA
jgi:hypothetical protein